MKIKFNLLSLLVILVISVNAQAFPVTFHLDANDTQYKTVQMWHNPDYLNFSDEFTASASSTIAQLHFNIGAENAEFWFDNISLCEVIESTEFVNVTFRVDMINEVVSASGVHLNGSFCNWSTADAVELTAAGTVYMTTLQLKKGETIEYKFVNGASDDWLKYETITGDCGYSQDNNRMIIVPENDVTLDLVCFEKCNACEPVAQSDFVAVTFRVDMINEVVSSSGVHLNGSFCNWSTADAVELTAAGTVYMTTLQLKKGETIEYKFVNGASDDWLKYETITGDCGYSQDNNRMIIVPENDVTLDLVCFEKCNACETSSIDCVMVESIKLFPNPTDGCFSISGLPEEQIQVSIYNSEGKLIFQTNTECRNTLTSELGNYPSGIYILSIKNTNNNELASYKLIKE